MCDIILIFFFLYFHPSGLSGIGIVMAVTGDDKLPLMVADIDPSGSAFQDGRVRVGDALLEVCGWVGWCGCACGYGCEGEGVGGGLCRWAEWCS